MKKVIMIGAILATISCFGQNLNASQHQTKQKQVQKTMHWKHIKNYTH